MEATLEAQTKYDPGKGVPLECWVGMRIHHAILAHVRKERTCAKRMKTKAPPEPGRPEQRFVLVLERDELDRLLGELPGDDRRLLVEIYFSGKTESEIAAEHQKSRPWVRKHKSGILKVLRGIAQKWGD